MKIKPYKKSTGRGKSNIIFTLLLTILFLMPTLGAKAQTKEPYIVLKDGTATFYYNSSKPEGALPLPSGWNDANWPEDTRNSVIKVVFDASFKDYKPTSCTMWFDDCHYLTEISGMKENLNTANVKGMYRMFCNCGRLTTLDLSNFNTANVENMSGMFLNCSSLTTLDVSNFNTANVTDMSEMFWGCDLTTLDLSNFNTANVTDMCQMFWDCSSLITLDVSNFNTANVTNMDLMFYNCSSLTTLDVSNFNTANVTTMSSMFNGCSSLTTLDLSNLNTANVTDMSRMFSGCSSLTTLDVSNFNTANVTTMSSMFSGCSSLTTLDVSNFNTANVKYVGGMFYNCSSLTTLDVSNFNTANVTTMSSMFSGCSSLTTIDVSNFNTENVTNMGAMFYNCSSLTTLDVSNFNTANVTNMSDMFYNCKDLNAIFVGDNWSTTSVTSSSGMFVDCTKLYGGKGTAYNPDITDATYAKIDGGEKELGYFTKSGESVYDGPKPYVNIKDGIATFYYNSSKPEGALPLQSGWNDANWPEDTRNSVIKVVFDASFKDCKPTRCAYWFYQFKNLTEISGMKENLNTANVTNMSYMFYGCSHLTTLDLSNFNTANVTNMSYMFYGCSHLTTLDLSNFNTANATDMRNMFYGCSGLKSIFVGDGWSTSAVTSSDVMFEGCAKLYGGKGTAYNANITDATYAKIDGGVENPGYFTKSGEPAFVPMFAYALVKDGTATFFYSEEKPFNALPLRIEQDDANWTSSIRSSIKKVVFDESFKDYKPVKLSYWFNSMENLTEISGMENLNTENVEYMSAMFQFSKNLTSINLSGFNTVKVTDMTRLFYGCENLESIFVGDNWSTASVTKSSGMFDDCAKLYGGKGTAYNADITDATYAKIDGGKDAPGYFTKSGEPAFKIVIVSIEIATAPKTEYTEGEDFSVADGILSLNYNTGFKESIDLSKATITGYDKNKVGEQTLKIAYEGFETELKVTVKANQPTPVSSVADSPSIKVWSFNSTIYIETLPDTKYTIIDLNGRTIKSATTKSTKEEININKSGVFVLIINNQSFKITL